MVTSLPSVRGMRVRVPSTARSPSHCQHSSSAGSGWGFLGGGCWRTRPPLFFSPWWSALRSRQGFILLGAHLVGVGAIGNKIAMRNQRRLVGKQKPPLYSGRVSSGSWIKTPAFNLSSERDLGERLMPHFELYAGNKSLECHIGIHRFEDSKCVYCCYRLNPESVLVFDGELSTFSLE